MANRSEPPAILLLGETRATFLPNCRGNGLAEVRAFCKTFGGSTALIAAACAKLGVQSRFVTVLGEDAFGDFLADALLQAGCVPQQLLRTAQARTGQLFLAYPTDAPPEILVDSPTAAQATLTPADLQPEWFSGIRVFHFCADALQSASSRAALRLAVRYASAQNAVISMDTTLPAPVTDCDTLRAIAELEPQANLLCHSVSVQTAAALDTDWYRKRLRGRMKLWLLQCGDGTVQCVTKSQTISRPPLLLAAVDEPEGAALRVAREAFVAAFLVSLSEDHADPRMLSAMPPAVLRQWTAFAAAYAAFSRTRLGAPPSYGTRRQLETFLRRLRRAMHTTDAEPPALSL